MLLLALLLALLFFGLGFAYNVLWWFIIIAVVLALFSTFSGPRGGGYWW